jgi:hypothetical protein
VTEKGQALAHNIALALQAVRDDRAENIQTTVDELYDKVILYLKNSTPSRARRARKPKTQQQGRKGRRAQKKYKYPRTQDLYKKTPSLLAKHIREGVPWLEMEGPPLRSADIEALYKKLWSTRPHVDLPFSTEGSFQRDELNMADIFQAISRKDVKNRLRSMKNNTTPGPDSLEKKHLSSPLSQEILTLLFNLFLASATLPTRWRGNRTILIPKPGKDPSQVSTYRPITISSIISRLFWGIIDTTLRSVIHFSPRQKGFTYEAGCFNNIHYLNEIIRFAKKSEGLVAVQLDISKAFDTLPHQAIDADLRVKHLPEMARNIILASYKEVNTTIEHGGAKIEISLQRGVKQGDPL